MAQLEELLETVSKKLGVEPSRLKSDLQSGKMEEILKMLPVKDVAGLKDLMANSEQMAKIANSPQAKAILDKLKGK